MQPKERATLLMLQILHLFFILLQESGYYYALRSTLYYDPLMGRYFYYNQSTKEYEFHSKDDLSEYNGETGASDTSASARVSDK